MWCSACRQDVPALVLPETGRYSCPRCGAGSCGNDSYAAAAPHTDAAPQSGAGPPRQTTPRSCAQAPPGYDPWELEQQLRHVERLLRIDRPEPGREATATPGQWARLDASHVGPLGWHSPAVARAKAARKRAAQPRRPESWLPVLTWSVLAVGLMASAFGGVLLVWASVSGRNELWTLGMPVGLAGQIVLIIGLILQLDRLWHDSRHTAEKLQHVDDRLHDLNRTTALLGASPGTTAHSSYPHMAGGASPQMLLADLKTRLDFLTVKLGQQEW
jgi:hypothetical protein